MGETNKQKIKPQKPPQTTKPHSWTAMNNQKHHSPGVRTAPSWSCRGLGERSRSIPRIGQWTRGHFEARSRNARIPLVGLRMVAEKVLLILRVSHFFFWEFLGLPRGLVILFWILVEGRRIQVKLLIAFVAFSYLRPKMPKSCFDQRSETSGSAPQKRTQTKPVLWGTQKETQRLWGTFRPFFFSGRPHAVSLSRTFDLICCGWFFQQKRPNSQFVTRETEKLVCFSSWTFGQHPRKP